jgi:hypothetical protein
VLILLALRLGVEGIAAAKARTSRDDFRLHYA